MDFFNNLAQLLTSIKQRIVYINYDSTIFFYYFLVMAFFKLIYLGLYILAIDCGFLIPWLKCFIFYLGDAL